MIGQKQCRSRNQHVNGIITAQDMGYVKSWAVNAPPWVVGKVVFNLEGMK